MRRLMLGLMAAVTIGGTTACLDLDVVNENNPDIERALKSPGDVEQVIVSAFRIWYNTLHGVANITLVYPVLADEVTTVGLAASYQWSQEPRKPLLNDQLAPTVWIPRHPWDNFSECTANANDGLRRIKEGLKIMTVSPPATEVTDNTDRAYAYAKLWQGVCLGYLAATVDQFAAATEETVIPEGFENQLQWERENIKPYPEGLAVALKSIEESIDRAESTTWSTADSWVPGGVHTNAQIAQLAHTMWARVYVYSARTPAERAALDWQKVLFHTERGLTYDWGPTLASGVITDGSFLVRLTTTSSTSSSVLRADPHLIGPADNAGRYKAWLLKTREERDTFLITTPDRRITGATPNSSGAYFRYKGNNTGLSATALGTYNFSTYDWWRRSNYGGFTSTTGFYALATADENRLFRAEAMLRTGNLQEAANLINVTRTRPVKVGTNTNVANLPPVTVAGVPTVNGQCVPRKVLTEAQRRTPANADLCGDLLDALMWERQIENMGQDPMRAFFDRRGFGQLQEGTLLQMPISARYLVQIGIPIYTFGGVGQPGSAQ